MARKAARVSGVNEHNEGSGVQYIRYRLPPDQPGVPGKLVRRKIGGKQDAIDALDKIKGMRVSDSGIVPGARLNLHRPANEHRGVNLP